MKRTKLFTICALMLALTIPAGMGVLFTFAETPAAQSQTVYYNSDGTPLEMSFDKNGISLDMPYTKTSEDPAAYSPVPFYGHYAVTDPGNYSGTYSGADDSGSITLVSPGNFMIIGGELDASKQIDITFTANPNAAWGTGPTFIFAFFDSLDTAISAGNNAWNPENGAKFVAWCGSETDPAGSRRDNYNKVKINNDVAEGDYVVLNGSSEKNKSATLSIALADNAAESSALLDGKKFSSLGVSSSAFAGKSMYISFCVIDGGTTWTNLESRIKVVESEPELKPDPDPEPAGPVTYYDEKGGLLDWAFDANGVSTAIPYNGQGEKISSYYGIYEPNQTYQFNDSGSKFVLPGASFVRLGEGMDLTKAIDITMTMDPDNSWGQSVGYGRFLFALFDDVDKLMNAGNSAWDPQMGAKVTAFGYLDKDNEVYGEKFNHFEVGERLSDQVNLIQNEVRLTFYIGEEARESFVALNGKYFAPIDAGRSDFKDGKAYISLAAYEVALQAQIKISQSDISTTVHLRSDNTAFEAKDVPTTIGFPFAEPAAQQIEGFTFDKWYIDSSYVIAYDFDNDYIKGETTLYARYFDNSKEYVNVTLCSDLGNYEPITFQVEKNKPLPPIGNVFYSEGFGLKWRTESGLFGDDEIVTGDITLTAVWVEEEILLYHKMHGVVDETYLWEYLQDENGWDSEFTDYTVGDTFVDEAGNEIISQYYGSFQHDTSFRTYDQYTDFLLPAVGAITNLKRLDLSKEIVITFSVNNWDTTNENNPAAGDITFQLFDNLLSALKSGHNDTSAAKAAILTSTVTADVNYGRFKDIFNNVRSGLIGFEQDKQFVIKMFVSEDGTGNYVTVNGEKIEGALAGLTRADFKGGYAYLHIANLGSTHMFRCLVAQPSALTLTDAEHGSYTSDKKGDVLFKDEVTLTLTPDSGYAVKSVTVGGKKYYPDANNQVTFFKGWEDETVTVEFDVAYTLTFNTNGGTEVAAQTACAGEKFFRPSNPSKEGFKFAGWYTDEALTEEYNFSTAATGNITLYAKWIANEEQQPASSEGCGGNIGCSLAISLAALAGAGIILRKKRSY